MDSDQPLIVIVDDDAAIRDALSSLLASVGLESIGFGSTREAADAPLSDRPGCFILDIRMPGGSGLEFQRQMIEQPERNKPIIFLTAHGDIPMSVQAMKAGAVDFLTKPFRDQTLLDAVAEGIRRDREHKQSARLLNAQLAKFATLTPRERDVMRLVALGRLNKQIAYEMGISEVTVKLHRSKVMRKLALTSASELVRLWEAIAPHLPAADPPFSVAIPRVPRLLFDPPPSGMQYQSGALSPALPR